MCNDKKLIPDWVQEINNRELAKEMKDWDKKPMEEKYPSSFFTKSITFDYEAQMNLPQHVKDKMKADRENARRKLK